MVNVSLRQKLVVLHKFEIYTYRKYQISLFQIKKNPVVNPAKISFFFLEKMRVRPQENFGWKSEKKRGPKKKCTFCARNFWRLLDVQYYCGTLFWYKYWCPEILEYVRPLYSLHGRPLFQKVPNFLPKNRSWGTLSEAKCCPRRVQQKKLFLETIFICLD